MLRLVLQNLPGVRLLVDGTALIFFEPLPSQFVSRTVTIDKIIGIKIVFRDIRVAPARKKIPAQRDVESTIFRYVTESIFGHAEYVKAAVIMAKEGVIPHDGKFKKG